MSDQSVKDGTLDLERELSCSVSALAMTYRISSTIEYRVLTRQICTDVFYQPLTLLDCLHTFCGSCLKEWFSWQASAATKEHPYTCPACRAQVRGTKPNATVTTLLDMLLRAHPAREKSQAEKDGIAERYKPGDDVIPPVDISRDSDDSEDERVLENARELSLQEVGDRDSTRRSNRASGYGRQRRRREVDDGRGTYLSYRPEGNHTTAHTQARRLDHQSSLRSLVSASEPDSVDIQEEIMRQIMDEGLLEGVDLNNLTPAQEEEITERIARAFQRRQRDHATHRQGTSARPASPSAQRQSRRSTSSTSRHHTSTAPVSHPHLLDQDRRRRHRTSSHTSQTSVRSESAATRSEESLAPSRQVQPATRSATDLSQHPERPEWGSFTSLPHRRAISSGLRVESTISSNVSPASNQGHSRQYAPLSSTPAESNESSAAPRSGAVAKATVNCSRCEKPDIQSSVHYHCSSCSLGEFNLCLACYRAGKGCRHWYGFGYAASDRYQRLLAQPTQSLEQVKPHILSARRYHRTTGVLEEGLFCDGCFAFADNCYWHCQVCNEGAWGFCNNCVQQAKHCTHPLQCFSKVAPTSTNESRSDTTNDDDDQHLYPAPLSNSKAAFHFLLTTHAPPATSATLPNVLTPSNYIPLTFTVSCDVCRQSIPPSHTRFHCHVCNNGSYDICAPCYYTLGSTGNIRPEDGIQGWRRCLQGHRMSLVGFEDREGGSWRVIVRGFAGGWALKEDAGGLPHSSSAPPGQWKWKEEDGTSATQTSTARRTSTNLIPPDGGVGMRTQALWSRFPPDGVQDELAFPRNAIITEVENINGDWYWGVYAGSKGLFPGNFVRII